MGTGQKPKLIFHSAHKVKRVSLDNFTAPSYTLQIRKNRAFHEIGGLYNYDAERGFTLGPSIVNRFVFLGRRLRQLLSRNRGPYNYYYHDIGSNLATQIV